MCLSFTPKKLSPSPSTLLSRPRILPFPCYSTLCLLLSPMINDHPSVYPKGSHVTAICLAASPPPSHPGPPLSISPLIHFHPSPLPFQCFFAVLNLIAQINT